MLPPQAAYETCLRCHADLGKDKTAPCPRCAADPVVERQIYAQLTPAIRDLRRIFFGGALVFAVLTWLIDATLARAGFDTTRFLVVSGAQIAAFVILGVLAPVAPLATALVGFGLLAASWLFVFVQHPAAALTPSPGMALTVILGVAFLFAIKAGVTARRLRALSRA
jgi:hypothetical protein